MQEDLKEYLKEARQRFCKEVNKYNVSDNLQLRTECDSFLIAYDQAVAKAFSLQGVGKSFCGCTKPKPNYPEMVWCDDCTKEIAES